MTLLASLRDDPWLKRGEPHDQTEAKKTNNKVSNGNQHVTAPVGLTHPG